MINQSNEKLVVEGHDTSERYIKIYDKRFPSYFKITIDTQEYKIDIQKNKKKLENSVFAEKSHLDALAIARNIVVNLEDTETE